MRFSLQSQKIAKKKYFQTIVGLRYFTINIHLFLLHAVGGLRPGFESGPVSPPPPPPPAPTAGAPDQDGDTESKESDDVSVRDFFPETLLFEVFRTKLVVCVCVLCIC